MKTLYSNIEYKVYRYSDIKNYKIEVLSQQDSNLISS